MDATSIDLTQSEISKITSEEGTVTIHFSRAILIKTMTGSEERTKWYQEGELIYGDAEITSDFELPEGTLKSIGGDVGENIYTYRDMIPIPLKSHGRASCALKLEGVEGVFSVEAESVEIKMHDRPYYIEHIKH